MTIKTYINMKRFWGANLKIGAVKHTQAPQIAPMETYYGAE